LLQEKIFLNAGFLSHKFRLFQPSETIPLSIRMILRLVYLPSCPVPQFKSITTPSLIRTFGNSTLFSG